LVTGLHDELVISSLPELSAFIHNSSLFQKRFPPERFFLLECLLLFLEKTHGTNGILRAVLSTFTFGGLLAPIVAREAS
jgi:hypothetical protein